MDPVEAVVPTLIISTPGREDRAVQVHGRLFIGRVCFGIDEEHRLLLGGINVSRDHCQVLVEPDRRNASLVDTSTNGTRVNGALVERSVPLPLHDGDRIGIGRWTLRYRAAGDTGVQDEARTLTAREIEEGRACVVCGDLVDYTTLTEAHGGPAVFAAMHQLFDRLRLLLRIHRGTLYDYVGDAFLAIWEEAASADAARRGLEFAIAAAATIDTVAPSLSVRRLDGSPLRMGWAVTHGNVAMSAYGGALAGLLGDPVNVGFRLAGLAGRDGRACVLVSGGAVAAGAVVPGLGAAETVTVKGHRRPVEVHQVPSGAGVHP